MDAAAWDERYATTELVWSVEPNQFVAAECADLRPGRALDLAAGEGRNAIWLAELGWQVTAVDYAKAGLDKGRRLISEREVAGSVDWVCADVTDWSPAHGFDLCVIAYLQLAAHERRAAVRNGYAGVLPGGTFLLVGHDATNLTEGTGGPQYPHVLMTAEDVLADLEGESFEVVRAERVEREVTTPEGPRTAYDVLVRVVRSS